MEERKKHESKAERKRRRTEKRMDSLFEEVSEGSLLSVERRISKRPKLLFAEDHKGRRALHIAASSGFFQIASLLLRRGADINCTDRMGNTALHSACKHKRWEIAELLVEKGALKTRANLDGDTPLSYGLEEALSEIRGEEERLLQKQEWIVEERKKFQNDPHNSLDQDSKQEEQWREKLMEEHCFEYLEGGGSSRRIENLGDVFMEGWFTADEKLSDEDWWEELGRQMRNRYNKFHAFSSTKSQAIRQQRTESTESAESASDEPRQRPYHGMGAEEKMAWERGRFTSDQAPPRGGQTRILPTTAWHIGYQQRAAAHALAWERFISMRTGPISYKDVPWPEVPAGGDVATEAMMLPLEHAGDGEMRRRAVREALRRWHPDKFGQRFGGRLVEAERDRILERVKVVSQALTALV